jgi:hypothetical protein
MSVLFPIAGIAFLLSLVPLGWTFISRYLRLRGERAVICPETISPERVEIAAGRAAWTGIAGETQLQISSCSRWPLECPQTCLEQIEAAPDGCLVRLRLRSWFEGAACSRCGEAIPEISSFRPRPGLMGPSREVLTWHELTPAALPELLGTHRPLCPVCVSVERAARLPRLSRPGSSRRPPGKGGRLQA